MSMLSVKEVSKSFGEHQALKMVSLEIGQGKIFGLLGPNGAGKTTLIRIINQITAPDSGSVYFEGEELAPRHIAQIGYLPEERGLYPKMRVGEQLLYLARLKDLNKKEATKRVNQWLERFDIVSWRNKNIEELSKGMAQKVQFIATVIHRPRLLIFDEPFTGFDPVNARLIKDEIATLRNEGATVIFSTHRMESVEAICDEIALLHHGQKILEGPIDTIKEAYKQNIFEALLESPADVPKLTHGTVLLSQQKGKQLYLQIKNNNAEPNPLATELMQHGRLVSFRESIPGLDDIFIQKVQS